MWDQRYRTEEYVYGTRPNDFLASVSDRIAKGRVLCLAEGEGRNAVFLARQGHQVLAVDQSAVGLAKAQRLAATCGVSIETRTVDLASFEIVPESWDAVISIFAHVPSQLRRTLHRQVVGGLRPGGILVLEGYTPAQLQYKTGGPPDLDKLMTLADLREELVGLTFMHALELEREVIEGTLHTGLGAVVQVLAVKPGERPVR
jgi:2-polyprenyl-3-methyl-5-hydroxy-6-metoxy-1,4-benzoquinol methylase